MATGKGGYDYEFVAPNKSLECPICLLTLCDPHVVSCCGNEFCQLCIQRVLTDGKPCPVCNDPSFTSMLHKKLLREVNALLVRCPQRALGCQWEGELGKLQHHINPEAETPSSDEGCGFIMVPCTHQCGQQLQRNLIREHEMEACSKRPIEVQITSLAKKFEAVSTENQGLKQDLCGMKENYEQELKDIRRDHKTQQEVISCLKEELKELTKSNELQIKEVKQAHDKKVNQMEKQLDQLKQKQELKLKQTKDKLDELEKMHSDLKSAHELVKGSCDWLKRRIESMVLSLKANNINA